MTAKPAEQIRQVLELLIAVSPHIEQVDTLQARKDTLEKRCNELQASLHDIIEQTNAARKGGDKAGKDAMDRADAHWKQVTEGLEAQKANAALKLAEFETISKKQVAEFDAKVGELQKTVRDLTAQRDKLSEQIGKLKASVAATMAAL